MAEPDITNNSYRAGNVELFRCRLSEILRDSHVAGGIQLRKNKEIGVGDTVIEPVNSQHIPSVLQSVYKSRNINRFEFHRLLNRTVGQCRRVPLHRFRGITAGNRLAVEISNKAVFVFHAQC